MARRPTDSLIFDSLRLEGGLFVPAVLEKAARGEHTAQKAPDYNLPKGLSLVDEQGRAFRIASAVYKTFEPTRARKDVDAAHATIGFATELFRDALGYADFALCAEPVTLADRSYPVTALAVDGRVPVIIAPHTLELDEPDERFAVIGSGSRRRSAYQLAQQFLNASAHCTWALVTNGRQLRLVRDADTLTRPAYLETDLELILRDQRYADFAAVWRLFHASRVGESSSTCIWDAWKQEGQDQGERVREGLRGGVTEALIALGTGLLEHSANEQLRLKLQNGDLKVGDYLQQLLRLIYRFLFIFTVEERGLLHISDDRPEAQHARDTYAQGYALRRLRDRALRRAGFDRHHDLWSGVLVVFRGLANGEPRLALPALSGLFAHSQCTELDSARLENRVLLTAMRHLRWSAASGQLSAIDYRNMDAEELGSVYESLLELVPTADLPARRFGFIGLTDPGSSAGNARKTSGSYYTPDSLVKELIRSALDPVIAQKIANHPDDPVKALLALTVCDPSCGSGHFLLAAARRIAEKIAELRAIEGAVRPDDYRHALREVASHCLYGVDLNPMAVELCRVAIWLETVDPGKPLGFLNHHIRTGNSLLGTTPELIAQGLPDDAFTAIEGDDSDACSELKKRNRSEREGFGPLFQKEEQSIRDRLRQAASAIEEMDDSQADLLQRKEVAFASTETAPEFRRAKLLADLWCAAFAINKHYAGNTAVEPNPAHPESQIVSPVAGHLLHSQDELFGQSVSSGATNKTSKGRLNTSLLNRGQPVGITTQHLRDFVQGRPLPAELESKADHLARHYNFFHWHLAFPRVFEQGGFDCMLGNPPWDTLSPDAKEFFATYVPEVRSQDKKEQEETIGRLLESPAISGLWEQTRRHIFASVHFIKDSGRFKLFAEGNLGKGDFNVYRMFAELALQTTRQDGCASQFLPEGIYNGANCAAIRSALFTTCRLEMLLGFENTREIWFKGVHTAMKFAMYVARIGGRTEKFYGAFNIRTIEMLNEIQRGAGLQVPVAMVHEFSPDALAIMEFGDQRDIDIAAKMYSRAPKFGDETAGPPMRTYMREFDMGNDREVFGADPNGLPLYEGRMVDQFDHRAKGYRSGRGRTAVWRELQFGSTDKSIQPQWRVPHADIPEKVRGRMDRYRVGFCDVTSPTNERSLIAALLPPGTVSGDKVPTILFTRGWDWAGLIWLAAANSFAMDFIVRKKVALKMSYTVLDSLPFPRLSKDDQTARAIVSRALKLTCCGPEMIGFWNSMAEEGWVALVSASGPPPGIEDDAERLRLRAELDTIVARDVFNLTATEMDYILATFSSWRQREEKKYGEFRTRRLILEAWEALEKPEVSNRS